MSTVGITSVPAAAAPPTALVPNQQQGGSGLSFGDILDAVNPLQHIPIVSGLYRAATGSHISEASQVAGDTIYGAFLPGGAIMGLASSVADVAVKEVTGSDISQHIVGTVTSASAAAPAGAATPLIPSAPTTNVSSATGAVNNSPALGLLRISQNTQSGNAQYERAQAFDALNSKLVKMAV